MPRTPKLLAFLFTDIQGSTAQRVASPEAMRRAQRLHHEIIRRHVRSHGGRLHLERGEGDSTFSTFANAPDALAAITAIQQNLAQQEWTPDAVIRIRAALHVGTATKDEFGLEGSAIDRCARIRAVAHGGQTLLSLVAAEHCRAQMPERAELKRLGWFRLKDLPDPEQLFQLCHPDLTDNFPPLNTPDERIRIPRERTPFVGRTAETDALTRTLAESSLVTVVGAGGSGKTRLALHVAQGIGAQFADGVRTVELAPVTDASQFLDTVIKAALPFTSQSVLMLPTTEAKHDALIDQLRASQLLLIFDNSEHLAEACTELLVLLHRECPALKLLVTGQHRLGLNFEKPFVLPPMSVPDERTVTRRDAASLLEFDAIRLFVTYAQDRRAEFVLSEETKETVAAVCRSLNGLPLGIELVAAQCAELALNLAAESLLEDFFGTASDGPPNALPRQRSLQETITWSYELLDEAERSLLARLSVFADGWTAQAAWDICRPPGVSRSVFQNLLRSLVRKSLVSRKESEGGEGRFTLLQPIFRFLQTHSEPNADEQTSLLEVHSRWFQTLVQNAHPHLEGEQPRVWLDTLEQDHGNLWQAIQTASEQKRVGDALAMAVALSPFWVLRGYCREGLSITEALLEQSEAAQCGSLWISGQLTAATLCYHLGHYEQAGQYTQAANASTDSQDKRHRGQILSLLGDIAYARQRYEEAKKWQTEALALVRDAGAGRQEAVILNNLGNIAALQQDWQTAAQHYHLSRVAAVHNHQNALLMMVLQNQAMVAFEQGRLDEAKRYFAEAYLMARKVENQSLLPTLLYNFSEAALRMNRLREARALAYESLFGFEALGDKRGFRYALVGYASTLAIEASPPEMSKDAAALVSVNVPLLANAVELFHIAENLDRQMGVTANETNSQETNALIAQSRQLFDEKRTLSELNAGISMPPRELKDILRRIQAQHLANPSRMPALDSETAVARMLPAAARDENDALDVTSEEAFPDESG